MSRDIVRRRELSRDRIIRRTSKGRRRGQVESVAKGVLRLMAGSIERELRVLSLIYNDLCEFA